MRLCSSDRAGTPPKVCARIPRMPSRFAVGSVCFHPSTVCWKTVSQYCASVASFSHARAAHCDPPALGFTRSCDVRMYRAVELATPLICVHISE